MERCKLDPKNASRPFAGIHRRRIADSFNGFGSSDRRLRADKRELQAAHLAAEIVSLPHQVDKPHMLEEPSARRS
jgi:hypothetical protein